MEIIINKTFDNERALYGSENVCVKNCRFEGEADGECALKESDNILVEECYFDLRYEEHYLSNEEDDVWNI